MHRLARRFLPRQRIARRGSTALLLVTFVVGGCSGSHVSPLRGELANRGPVALSEHNPYLASNQILALEAKDSPILQGFIEKEGAPDAIEINRALFSEMMAPIWGVSPGDDELIFYYTDQNRQYTLNQAASGWIIRGPETIPEARIKQLSTFVPIRGKAAFLNQERSLELPEVVRVIAPDDSSPKKSPERQIKVKPKNKISQKKAPPRNPQRAELTPPSKSSGDSAIQRPQNLPVEKSTETSPSFAGDVIHKVTHPGETLHTIANWYTGDPSNAARIASINGISDVNLLNIGATIRVPRYLLKRDAPLPESEVQRLR